MKKVLLLGATSDIGQALAERYAAEGNEVWLAGRNIEHMNSIASDLQIRHETKVDVFEFNALDYVSHQKFYNSLPAIPDVAICIFGYLGDQERGQTHWEECSRILETNYNAAVSILNLVAESFATRESGTIIGISSVAGDRGRQSNYFYGSAKAGFTAFLSGLRNRMFKNNVHVLTVKPGFVDTKMTEGLDLPPKLTAQPEQVAKAIIKSAEKKKNTIYVLPIWWVIMTIIKNIPEFIFKKLKL